MRWIVMLALLCGCWTDHYHVYGTDFDSADGVRVLIWPGEDGSFLYTVADEVGKYSVRSLAWPLPARLPETFDDQLSAAIVVLPEQPPAPLWTRTTELMERVRQSSPGAGLHIVQDEYDWAQVGTAHAAAGRIQSLRQCSLVRRPSDGGLGDAVGQELGEAIGQGLAEGLAFYIAAIWIVPEPGHRNRFRVTVHCEDPELRQRTRSVDLTQVIELATTAKPTWLQKMFAQEIEATRAMIGVVVPRDLEGFPQRLADLAPLLDRPGGALLLLRSDNNFAAVAARIEGGRAPEALVDTSKKPNASS